MEQEELLWYQKSREKWLEFGDRNTKYFHTSTIIRRKSNRIEALKNDAGIWVNHPDELENLAIDYFKKLYSVPSQERNLKHLPWEGFHKINHTETMEMLTPFATEEIHKAMKSMGSFKALGIDGFQATFYQKHWPTVGESITRLTQEFFAINKIPKGMNDTLLVLIAKVSKPETISQFRPISLCNVTLKLITKILVGRMQGLLHKLVGPTQASFIPGRLSSDNIVVVQEAVHSMKRKKGRKGWMLLKLDLEKAYDRLQWEFVEDTLKAVGFLPQWIHWKMACISSSSMKFFGTEKSLSPSSHSVAYAKAILSLRICLSCAWKDFVT